jgi:hypothetical protein
MEFREGWLSDEEASREPGIMRDTVQKRLVVGMRIGWEIEEGMTTRPSDGW